MPLVEEIGDVELEAFVKVRVTEEFIEFVKRFGKRVISKQDGLNSAAFTFRLGLEKGMNEVEKELRRLRSEVLDPEVPT